MHNTQQPRVGRKPAITIGEADYDVIANLALQMEPRNPGLSMLILTEIDRARIVPAGRPMSNVVRLGSEVTFEDGNNNTTRVVRLVTPGDADIGSGSISVVSPVGVGLIGMSVGGEINWPCPDGRPRTLKILDVKFPQ